MKTLVLVSLFILTTSCGKKVEEHVAIPEGILTKDELARVLVDFSLAESAANMNISNVPIHKIDSVYAFNPLKENGIRRSQYDSSLVFYANHPETYKGIYDTVLVMLSALKAGRNEIRKDSTLK